MAVHKTGERIFCIAAIWRETPDAGQAFTMLTMKPGPDIAPITIGRSLSWNMTPGPIGSIPRSPQSH